MARKTSRKRRKRGARPAPVPIDVQGTLERGYSRSRKRDEEARAALVPLAAGERPGAVTVAAIAAAVLAVANLVAMIADYDAGEGGKTVSTILGTVVLAIVAVGMWRVRYWAVLGMQALLAITMVLGALALLTAVSVGAALLALAIIAAAGTLFWFLVKAMARIQMPTRPGAG
ncbi:MAG TPA: hypothetical protein VFQ12_01990 [Thermoleophilaceae bacterium]|nr:hypothetical protein [Thermoleophilaceae bacterium]